MTNQLSGTESSVVVRDEHGRILPGVSLNPAGRPTKKREDAALVALRNAASDEDLAAIARQIVDKAKRGNWQAIRFLFAYTVGLPVRRTELTGAASGELWAFIAAIRGDADGDNDGG